MLKKQSNMLFLQAVQEQKFSKAYEIGQQILNHNPGDLSIRRFMAFLKEHLQDFQQEEEYEEEEDNEIEPIVTKFRKPIQISQSQKIQIIQKTSKPPEIPQEKTTRGITHTNQKKLYMRSNFKPQNNQEPKIQKAAIPSKQIMFPSLK